MRDSKPLPLLTLCTCKKFNPWVILFLFLFPSQNLSWCPIHSLKYKLAVSQPPKNFNPSLLGELLYLEGFVLCTSVTHLNILPNFGWEFFSLDYLYPINLFAYFFGYICMNPISIFWLFFAWFVWTQYPFFHYFLLDLYELNILFFYFFCYICMNPI